MIMADNNENKVLNVPHLRFPEFSGEWNRAYTFINDLEFNSGLEVAHADTYRK